MITGGADGASTARTPLAEMMATDVALADALTPTAPGSGTATLVTGATGFFGAALVATLVIRTTDPVFCLVRATDDADAARRLEHHLRGQDLWSDGMRSRLRCLAGDVSSPRLGRCADDWTELSRTVGRIYHAAAYVNGSLPYAVLRAANVLGTVEVLRLAVAAGAVLHHVSTVAAGTGADPGGSPGPGHPVPLDELPSGYAQSKWVAEQLVAKAVARGLRARIHRLGALAGHRGTGRSNPADFRWLFLRACLDLAAAPVLPGQLCWVPVDVAAEAVVALAAETGGPLLSRIAPDTGVPWADVFSWLRRSGHRLSVVDVDTWWRRLHDRVAADPVDPVAGMAALAPALPSATPWPDDGTWARLARLGVAAAPFDRALLQRCVAASLDPAAIGQV